MDDDKARDIREAKEQSAERESADLIFCEDRNGKMRSYIFYT